ncbi:uncharacterized protein BDR25DRAFT_352504 [Lindgomyces ingoldianus]|uniref:Uncharacterized protein n=1 Tax=Lindgomyces ingoldianus TaxID=673940 RepID=A0ACB6R1G8_9PLEO|nr:uncharacterized protein BDR25DRAFT_352504 [Lindgomyces ingoldianus]KAF2473026.1 hypothetical protein BDR25DRAFT_352504 [Lindgomyces ingoldianus]
MEPNLRTISHRGFAEKICRPNLCQSLQTNRLPASKGRRSHRISMSERTALKLAARLSKTRHLILGSLCYEGASPQRCLSLLCRCADLAKLVVFWTKGFSQDSQVVAVQVGVTALPLQAFNVYLFSSFALLLLAPKYPQHFILSFKHTRYSREGDWLGMSVPNVRYGHRNHTFESNSIPLLQSDASNTGLSTISGQKRSEATKQPLPPFDKALGTKKWCFIGLATIYVLSLGLIICGTIAFVIAGERIPKHFFEIPAAFRPDATPVLLYPTVIFGSMSDSAREITILAINTCVTVSTEILGYIHATSLRWALYHEGRLHSNSNLRLFTSCRQCRPNSWYVNVVWGLLLTVSYSCASQIIVGADDILSPGDVGFNSTAIVILGACLLFLCILSTWSLFPSYDRKILSWSSDPLNTTLALLHDTWQRPELHPARLPRAVQPQVTYVYSRLKIVVAYLWFLVPLIGTGGGAILRIQNQQLDKSFIADSYGSIPTSLLPPCSVVGYCIGWHNSAPAVNILFLAAVQILYTLAIHSAEQLVNLHRDEAVWRCASSNRATHGTIIAKESTKAAFTSWQTAFLLVMKPVSHWLFGLCIVVNGQHLIAFHPMPLFTLAGVAILLAAFGTFLASHKQKGPQPATYGDLMLLAELVDDWGDGAGGRLFWGDKGIDTSSGGKIRLAGTSSCKGDVTEIIKDGRDYDLDSSLPFQGSLGDAWMNEPIKDLDYVFSQVTVTIYLALLPLIQSFTISLIEFLSGKSKLRNSGKGDDIRKLKWSYVSKDMSSTADSHSLHGSATRLSTSTPAKRIPRIETNDLHHPGYPSFQYIPLTVNFPLSSFHFTVAPPPATHIILEHPTLKLINPELKYGIERGDFEDLVGSFAGGDEAFVDVARGVGVVKLVCTTVDGCSYNHEFLNPRIYQRLYLPFSPRGAAVHVEPRTCPAFALSCSVWGRINNEFWLCHSMQRWQWEYSSWCKMFSGQISEYVLLLPPERGLSLHVAERHFLGHYARIMVGLRDYVAFCMWKIQLFNEFHGVIFS